VQKILKNIANLSSGYSFRGSVPVDANGVISVIQAGDISDDGSICVSEQARVQESEVLKSSILEDGDILLVSRGVGMGSFRSAVFHTGSNKAIASATVHVIRINDKDVLSEYLCSYLNSNKGQIDLLRIATGASVRMLSLNELKELHIPIPSPENQKSFSDLVNNIYQQKILLKKKQFILDQIRITSTSQLIK